MERIAQTWSIDLIVASVIFLTGILVFYVHTINISNETEESFNALSFDGDLIASMLLSEGFPSNWNKQNVITIGILADNKINQRKIDEFHALSLNDYQRTKSLFNTRYDYLFFLEDKKGIVNFGSCAIGSPDAIEADTSLAYFYQNTNEMLIEMQELGADIYTSKTAFFDNLNKYKTVLVEDPNFATTDINNNIAPFVQNGGNFLVSEKIIGGGGNALGISYEVKSSADTITVTAYDSNLRLNIGDTYNLKSSHSVSENGALNYLTIAEYSNGKDGIAKWNYGNGLIYYFADFEVTSGNNFQTETKNAVNKIMRKDCTIKTPENSKNLIKISRVSTYNNKPVTMNLYIWE